MSRGRGRSGRRGDYGDDEPESDTVETAFSQESRHARRGAVHGHPLLLSRPARIDVETSLPELVSTYGYLAVFFGTLLEGEAILMIAAYAAHRGYLSLPVVIAVAVVGATLGDQLFFLAGRFFGPTLVTRVQTLRDRQHRVNALLVRHHAWLIVALRFAYGLRIAGPIIIGMSELPASRFFFFNAVGALIWAPVIAAVGYLLGETLEWLLRDLRAYEMAGLAALAVIGLGIAAVVRFRRKRDE